MPGVIGGTVNSIVLLLDILLADEKNHSTKNTQKSTLIFQSNIHGKALSLQFIPGDFSVVYVP
jgi:hypothetical protein